MFVSIMNDAGDPYLIFLDEVYFVEIVEDAYSGYLLVFVFKSGKCASVHYDTRENALAEMNAIIEDLRSISREKQHE